MMNFLFHCIHGCGNSFVLLDCRTYSQLEFDTTARHSLCTMANTDGCIFLEPSIQADVRMRYFNRDGNEAEMCGNGIRASMLYLVKFGNLTRKICNFETMHRLLQVEYFSDEKITVDMGEVTIYEAPLSLKLLSQTLSGYYLNTGVPHFVTIVSDIETIDIETVGAQIRHHPHFFPQGTNVNFVEIQEDISCIRTFERGVEAETLACGTGAVAAGYVLHAHFRKKAPITFQVRSKDLLTITLSNTADKPSASLTGPAVWKKSFQAAYVNNTWKII